MPMIPPMEFSLPKIDKDFEVSFGQFQPVSSG